MVALKHMEWNNGYECYYSAKYPKKIWEYKNTVGDVKEYTSFGFCTVTLARSRLWHAKYIMTFNQCHGPNMFLSNKMMTKLLTKPKQK